MKKQDVNISIFLILFFVLVIVLISVGIFSLNSIFHIVNISYSITEVLLLSVVIGISSMIVISIRQIDYLSALLRKKWEFCEIYLREKNFETYLHETHVEIYQLEMVARDKRISDEEVIEMYGEDIGRQIIERRKLPIGKLKMRDINVKTFEVIKLDDLDRRTGVSTSIYTDEPFIDEIGAYQEVPWRNDKKTRIVEYAFEQGALRGVIAWLGHHGWEPVYINFDAKGGAPRGLFKCEIH